VSGSEQFLHKHWMPVRGKKQQDVPWAGFPPGLKSLRDNRRTRARALLGARRHLVGHRFSHQRHLPLLRRLASSYILYPVLLHWANVFRASGAALQLTNQKLLTTRYQLLSRELPPENSKLTATKPDRRDRSAQPGTPKREPQSQSAGGATERSPARKGWERWQLEF
jgi:hypothetical protein